MGIFIDYGAVGGYTQMSLIDMPSVRMDFRFSVGQVGAYHDCRMWRMKQLIDLGVKWMLCIVVGKHVPVLSLWKIVSLFQRNLRRFRYIFVGKYTTWHML